jgi:formate C-acetyltransferase
MAHRPYSWLYLTGFTNDAGEHPFLKEAHGRAALYAGAPAMIPEEGVVCGNLDLVLSNEVATNRISRHFLNREPLERLLASPDYTDAEKEDVKRRVEAFTPFVLTNRADAVYTEEETRAWESLLATSNHYNGHQVLDYERLLREGVSGTLRRIQGALDRAVDPESIVFLQSLRISWEGVSLYIRRHAEEALRRLGDKGLSTLERDRLERIARIQAAIAGEAPTDFEQGVCLLYHFVGFADYDSIGRFDQYLWDLYDRSRRGGMSVEQGREVLRQAWRMMDRNGAILNMTVGGRDAKGTRHFNELTRLVLEVTREMGLKGPNLCLRVDAGMPDDQWKEVHLSLSAGQALPALYNEDMIVAMLLRAGIRGEDAWDFCLAGCSQVVIPGRSSFACDIGCYSPLKCLELAIHEGFDRFTGKQVGPGTPPVASMKSFDDLMAAYRVQTDFAIRIGVGVNDKDHSLRPDFASCIRSALTNDCVERGRSLFLGGARYYAVQNEVVGLTNTANALAAIRQVVFDESRIGLDRLVSVLDADFEGEEALRQYLVHKVPKFGNGIESVDRLRSEIAREFFTKLASHPGPLGGRHWPGEVIFHYNVQYGRTLLASPDGRKAGTPLADSSGPSQGTDVEGVTGILQSMKRIEYCGDAYPNTCSCLNLKFDRKMWKTSPDRMVAMLKTYMKTVMQVQINVVSARDLQEALLHPEAHRSLVVRVGGYSAYFTSLDPDIQRDVLSRTTQEGY